MTPSAEDPIKKLQAGLGASTWALLHTVAAQYPKRPTQQQQSHVKQFFYRIAEFYPCRWCAKDFAESIQNHPIQAQNREALSIWLCERHNEVNEKIGKPIVPDCKTAWKKWVTDEDNDEEELSTNNSVLSRENAADLKWLDDDKDEGIDFKPLSTEELMKDCNFCESTMGKERYEKMKSLLKR